MDLTDHQGSWNMRQKRFLTLSQTGSRGGGNVKKPGETEPNHLLPRARSYISHIAPLAAGLDQASKT